MSYQVDRPSHLFHDSCTSPALMKDTFSVTLPVPTSTASDTILGPYYDHRSLFDISSTHQHDMNTPAAATTTTNGWMLSPVPEHHAAAASLVNVSSNNSSIGVNNHGPSPPPAAIAAHRAPLPTPPLSSVESHQHHHPSSHIHFPSWSSAMNNNNNNTALIPPPSMTYWLYPAQHNLHASPVKDHTISSSNTTRRHKASSPSSPNAKSTNKTANSSSTPPRRYKCSVCVKRFSRPSSLATHMHSHTGEVYTNLYYKRDWIADEQSILFYIETIQVSSRRLWTPVLCSQQFTASCENPQWQTLFTDHRHLLECEQ